ncbi:hypothetical protein SCB29_38195, partial [Paraburkholderia sp. SIMBA_055]
MINTDFVMQNVGDPMDEHAALIAKLANLAIAAQPNCQSWMAEILKDTALNAEGSIERFRDLFIDYVAYWDEALP